MHLLSNSFALSSACMVTSPSLDPIHTSPTQRHMQLRGIYRDDVDVVCTTNSRVGSSFSTVALLALSHPFTDRPTHPLAGPFLNSASRNIKHPQHFRFTRRPTTQESSRSAVAPLALFRSPPCLHTLPVTPLTQSPNQPVVAYSIHNSSDTQRRCRRGNSQQRSQTFLWRRRSLKRTSFRSLGSYATSEC